MSLVRHDQEIIERLYMDEQVRVSILEDAIDHALRYGKLGKRSKARLKAALFAARRTREGRVSVEKKP